MKSKLPLHCAAPLATNTLQSMAICKFYQQGHCRKGSECNFEHIREGLNPPTFLNRSRDSDLNNFSNPREQPTSPPRRRSNRNKNFKNSHENLRSNETMAMPVAGTKKNKKKSRGNNPQNSHNISNNQNSDNVQNRKKKNKNKKERSFTKLPVYRAPIEQQQQQQQVQSQIQQQPGIKDYVNMVMSDLSTRPVLWHFSSYGLSLNATQSLPFPHLGTTELSADELRLQVYAEAAATGGRIDNYVKVVAEIKQNAENVTKALIPNLETVISETLRAHNIPFGATTNPNIQQYQQQLKQTLLQQRVNYASTQSSDNLPVPVPSEPPLFQPPTIQYQPQDQSNAIIPDDSFAFGMIPEIPPE